MSFLLAQMLPFSNAISAKTVRFLTITKETFTSRSSTLMAAQSETLSLLRSLSDIYIFQTVIMNSTVSVISKYVHVSFTFINYFTLSLR